MKIERNILTLPSGKTLIATELSPFRRGEINPRQPDGEEWRTSGDEAIPDPLTPAERREIAEFMIARWAAWGDTEATDRQALVDVIRDVPCHNSDGDRIDNHEGIAAAVLADFHVSPKGER